jgi:hypothetical protein
MLQQISIFVKIRGTTEILHHHMVDGHPWTAVKATEAIRKIHGLSYGGLLDENTFLLDDDQVLKVGSYTFIGGSTNNSKKYSDTATV